MERMRGNNMIYLPYLLILGATLLRLTASHPYNFVPIFFCILFFGASRPKREFAIPLLALIGVDMFLTTQQYGYRLTSDHIVAWLWYVAVMFLGAGMLRSSMAAPRVLCTSLLASVSFFLASNFTVWAAWTMYPKTLSGLGMCYVAALPFFRNSIVSETLFSLLIFSVARYSRTLMPARRLQGACS